MMSDNRPMTRPPVLRARFTFALLALRLACWLLPKDERFEAPPGRFLWPLPLR